LPGEGFCFGFPEKTPHPVAPQPTSPQRGEVGKRPTAIDHLT